MIEGIDGSIEVESLRLALKMQDIYEGLTFRPAPKLVDGSEH
jgi:hypothetical protein